MNTASYGLELFFALSIWGEAHTKGIDTRLECHSGASPRIFFQIWKFASEPCALQGGFGGMPPPPDNFFKMVRFGVYFDQLLSLKKFKNDHFLYKNFKNCNLHT